MAGILGPVWRALRSLAEGLLGQGAGRAAASGWLGRLAHTGPMHGLLTLALLAVAAYVGFGLAGKALGALARLAVIAAAVLVGYLLFIH